MPISRILNLAASISVAALCVALPVKADIGGVDDIGHFETCLAAANAIISKVPQGVDSYRLLSLEDHPRQKSSPAHCEIVGAINDRISPVDGQHYAIKFRLRLPTDWNGRLYMEGGGGSNGVVKDAYGPVGLNQSETALDRGFAVVTTDSGHDNDTNSDPNASGRSAFGLDPQARLDFGYLSYDVVTRVAKSIAEAYYGAPPDKSYFIGCSEGGREAAMMTQRYPDLYDGVAAGAPGIHFSYSASYAPFLLKTFGDLAISREYLNSDGIPQLNKLYTDSDIQLIADSVTEACDGLDGIMDGISSNIEACTTNLVASKLQERTCEGDKTGICLAEDQIEAFLKAMDGPVTSTGQRLYPGHPWDPGIGGRDGDNINSGFRAWWFGTYAKSENDARKVTLSTPQHAMLWQTPPKPLKPGEYVQFEMDFNIDNTPALAHATTELYPVSSAEFGNADSPDLDSFSGRGGKLILYHGAADAAFSALDTIKYWNSVNDFADGSAADFARLFIVPGMNHCGGGPATDAFDLLTPLVAWVEEDKPVEKIIANTTSPGFFEGETLSRPLCPYPSYAKYDGTGDPNKAESFNCTTE